MTLPDEPLNDKLFRLMDAVRDLLVITTGGEEFERVRDCYEDLVASLRARVVEPPKEVECNPKVTYDAEGYINSRRECAYYAAERDHVHMWYPDGHEEIVLPSGP